MRVYALYRRACGGDYTVEWRSEIEEESGSSPVGAMLSSTL